MGSITKEKLFIQIVDQYGRAVYTAKTPSERRLNIDLSGKAKGIYFLQINTDSNTFHKKILLQ